MCSSDLIELTSAANNLQGKVNIIGGDVVVTNNTATTLGTTSALGKLTLTSTGAIQGTDVINISGPVDLNAKGTSISLTNSKNQFGTVTLLGKDDVTLVEDTGLTLGLVDAKSLALTSNKAEIAGAAKILVSGATSLTASKNVLLPALDNQLSGLVSVTSATEIGRAHV